MSLPSCEGACFPEPICRPVLPISLIDPEIIEGRRDEGLEHVPVAALLGIVCYNEALKGRVDKEVQQRRLNLPVYARPGWYF